MISLLFTSEVGSAQCVGSAPCEDEGPELSRREIDAILRRSEKLLKEGRLLQALRTYGPADDALFTKLLNDTGDWRELSERARAVGWTSVVRLSGTWNLHAERASDPRVELVKAEARLRELVPGGEPLYAARHAEALVALSEDMDEAYATLAQLHQQGQLHEPEAYAALVRAARATEHAELTLAAQQQCVKLARRRARQVCAN